MKTDGIRSFYHRFGRESIKYAGRQGFMFGLNQKFRQIFLRQEKPFPKQILGNLICGGLTGLTMTGFLFTYESLKDILRLQNSMYNSLSISQMLRSMKSLLRSFLRLPIFMFSSFVQRSIYFSTLQNQSMLMIIPLSLLSSTMAHFASYPFLKVRNAIDLKHSKLLAYKHISIR